MCECNEDGICNCMIDEECDCDSSCYCEECEELAEGCACGGNCSCMGE